MKSFFTIILAVCCTVVLYFGNSQWAKKSEAFQEPDSVSNTVSQTVKPKAVSNSANNNNQLLGYAKNWPSKAVQVFQQRLTDHKPFNFLIIGSSGIGSTTSGWAHLLAANLQGTYGRDHMAITIDPYDGTSRQFIESGTYLKAASLKADLILFEPLTLSDNGNVDINNSLENLTTLMNACKQAEPDTTIVLTPPNPLYNAKYYPLQVDALKNFAARNQIAYLDHWTAWPSPHSVDIKNYLVPDQSAPNEKGDLIISDYLTKYFISK